VNRFGGKTFCEEEATQSVLENPPCQVLHISAHGQYRIDQPDFSYIQLAHGPLYTDDLFQHDLRYELVTLSACETGRSRAFAGDELIGLGRGFLFAGAGALVASLWRVNETLTLELMDEMYRRLDSGASKAAALREAQLALMRAYPGLHPAFWGAFELIGNADPLTNESHFMN
jgi:CHAT domain-containing protein